MRHKNLSFFGAMAALLGSHMGFSAREIPARATFTRATGYRSVRKPRSKRRKNPLRGTTYAAVFNVPKHC